MVSFEDLDIDLELGLDHNMEIFEDLAGFIFISHKKGPTQSEMIINQQ